MSDYDYSILTAKHYIVARKIARKMSRNHTEYEDHISVAYEGLLKGVRTFTPRITIPLDAWLGLHAGYAIKSYRKQRRWKKYAPFNSLDAICEAGEPLADLVADQRPNDADRIEVADLIHRTLGRLAPPQRRIVQAIMASDFCIEQARVELAYSARNTRHLFSLAKEDIRRILKSVVE